MNKKYLQDRHFIVIKNDVEVDKCIDYAIIDANDEDYVKKAKCIFNSIVSEDYFSMTIDYDNETYMMSMA